MTETIIAPAVGLHYDVREIPLSNGGVAIVDACDYQRCAKRAWYFDNKNAGTKRATKRVYNSTVGSMHRFILQCSSRDGRIVDHINGDVKDNRRLNLRFVTAAQNSYNRARNHTNRTGFKGVWKNYNKWSARIVRNGRTLYLGSFDSPELAALAYDKEIVKVDGSYARLNFPEASK